MVKSLLEMNDVEHRLSQGARKPMRNPAVELARAAACRRWGLVQVEFEREFENIVFRGLLFGELVYLRLTPVARRSAQHIQSELAILRLLDDSGVRVALPAPAMNPPGRTLCYWRRMSCLAFRFPQQERQLQRRGRQRGRRNLRPGSGWMYALAIFLDRELALQINAGNGIHPICGRLAFDQLHQKVRTAMAFHTLRV